MSIRSGLLYILFGFSLQMPFTSEAMASPLVDLKAGWRYSFDGQTWQDTDMPCFKRNNGSHKTITFRKELANLTQYQNPSLYIDIMSQPFEVRLDGNTIFRYLDTTAGDSQFKGYPWHLIELGSPKDGMQTPAVIDVVVRGNQQVFLGLCKKMFLGEPAAIYGNIFRHDLGILFSVLVLSVTSIVALFFAAFSGRRALLLSFSSLSFVIGLWIFSTPELKSRLFIHPNAEFWMPFSHLGLFLIPVALISYLREIFPGGIWRPLTWLSWVHSIYAVVVIILLGLNSYDYPTGNYTFNLIVPWTALLVLLNVSWLAIKNRSNARLIALGLSAFMIIAIHDWLVGMWILNWAGLWLHWGFLALMIVLAISAVSELKAVFAAQRDVGLAEEKYRLIKELAQNVAHDVKKPFLLLRLTIARLLECTSAVEIKRIADENAKAILTTAKHVDETLQAFLDLEGSSTLSKEFITLTDALDEIFQSFEPQLKQNGIRLIKTHGFRGKISVDVSKIRRSVANLIQNAIEAQPSGGELVLKTTVKKFNWVEVSITTPSFIQPNFAAKLFDRHFTFGKMNGTGLGLSIVKRFVELHGGRVGCVSDLQLGTTFTMTLPRNS